MVAQEIQGLIRSDESLESIVQESGKLSFLRALLPELDRGGHRVAVFSKSKMMLTWIGLMLREMGRSFIRIDGDVANIDQRQRLLDAFNAPHSPHFACLLTTRTGGVGINLTSADRVVIVDPDWNPAMDNQAVDRSFRIGQTRDVVVYRLISCGSLEEVIYRKHIFKGGLFQQAVTKASSHERKYQSYFTRAELVEALKLFSPETSDTHRQVGRA